MCIQVIRSQIRGLCCIIVYLTKYGLFGGAGAVAEKQHGFQDCVVEKKKTIYFKLQPVK